MKWIRTQWISHYECTLQPKKMDRRYGWFIPLCTRFYMILSIYFCNFFSFTVFNLFIMVWFLRLFLVPFAQISIRFFRFFVALGYCCNFRKSLTKHSFMIFKHWHYLSFGYSHMQLNLWLMQFFVDLIFACSSSSCFFLLLCCRCSNTEHTNFHLLYILRLNFI